MVWSIRCYFSMRGAFWPIAAATVHASWVDLSLASHILSLLPRRCWFMIAHKWLIYCCPWRNCSYISTVHLALNCMELLQRHLLPHYYALYPYPGSIILTLRLYVAVNHGYIFIITDTGIVTAKHRHTFIITDILEQPCTYYYAHCNAWPTVGGWGAAWCIILDLMSPSKSFFFVPAIKSTYQSPTSVTICADQFNQSSKSSSHR